MKNSMYKGIIYLTMTGFLLASCHGFLDENPQNVISTQSYYTTEQDAISAVNSIYSNLGSTSSGPEGTFHSTGWFSVGLSSDEMDNLQAGAIANDQLGTFTWSADNSDFATLWRIHYKTITLANIAIGRIPGIEMDETERTRLVNEAKFLRGLVYFNLVRMFGKVPLVLTEDAPLYPAQAEVADIYTQIVADLTDASNLPKDGDIDEGRATQGAALACLAKVQLTLGNWQAAADAAKTVINSSTYALWDDFADAFAQVNRGGKEAIFSVGFGDAGGAISFWEFGQFQVRLLPPQLSTSVAGIRNTQGWQVATQTLYDAFDDADERKAKTFLTEFTADNGDVITLPHPYIQKYWDHAAEPNAGDSKQDFPVIRYPDVLLTFAEAQAHLNQFGDANQYVNMVRARAGLADVNLADTQAFVDEILVQRRKEFVAEGHRYYDLQRTQTLVSLVAAGKPELPAVDPKYYLYAIPQIERNANINLGQNPGF